MTEAPHDALSSSPAPLLPPRQLLFSDARPKPCSLFLNSCLLPELSPPPAHRGSSPGFLRTPRAQEGLITRAFNIISSKIRWTGQSEISEGRFKYLSIKSGAVLSQFRFLSEFLFLFCVLGIKITTLHSSLGVGGGAWHVVVHDKPQNLATEVGPCLMK